MKKHILAITLAGTLIAPLGVFAQDLGGTPPPPPPDGGTFQSQPPMEGNGGFQPQPPIDGGGFRPQPPMDGGGFQFQPPIDGNERFQPQPGMQPQPIEGQQPKFGDFRQPFPGGGMTGGQFPGGGATGGQFPEGQNQKPTPFFGQQRQEGGPTPFFDQQNEKRATPFFKNEEEGRPNKEESMPQFEFEGDFEEQQDPGDYVDPQELRQAQRQINDLKKQAGQLLRKTAKKTALAGEAAELQSFISELATYATGIQSGSREALQDFYDAELWEKMNAFRAKIEMPAEISKMEKDLTRLEKLMAAKTFAVDGVDMGIIRSNIGEIREAINGAKNALSSGDAESAREYLQVIYEGTHPGEIYGVLQQLRNVTKELKRVKNADVKQAIIEVITPVYEAIAEGDFREANMALNEINRELFSILGKVRNTRTVNTDTRNKMRALEQKLEGRIQQIETQGTNQSGAYIPYQSAKSGGMGSILSSVKDFFGL